ncbi:MAG: 50S ribosomal protein L10 [Candidatus Marinimicrobia bacterium CG08_land_8_20_14_0_20_45_22]|nr:MAG: 50S ribosomal protein L10 [Candidatus Marinimicrobia bacterium CG08_land_8_20_14_0_20_45_22]
MPNLKKTEIVQDVTDKFSRAKGIFFTDYKGMTVQQMNALRKELFAANIEYKIAKKTLAKIAAKETGKPVIDRLLEGQTGMAFSYEDPVAPGKIITAFIKKNKLEKLSITGCIFEGEAYGAESIETIINLPSKKDLIASLVGTLAIPMSNLVGVLNATMGGLVGTLKSLNETKTE